MEPIEDQMDDHKRSSSIALATSSSENSSNLLPEMESHIIEHAAFEQCLNNESPVNLALVCKAWQKEFQYHMQPGKPCYKAWYGVTPENEHIYQQFLNGTLIYKPFPQSDEGMIRLKISDLINPLEETFNLSGCGYAGEYLSISTGYRKGMKSENSKKLEIWLAPRFMIEKKLKSSASHLEPIMGNWKEATAPIGILWSWGGWEALSWYDYLTSKNALEISSKSLYENRRQAARGEGWELSVGPDMETRISCSFVNQNKNY